MSLSYTPGPPRNATLADCQPAQNEVVAKMVGFWVLFLALDMIGRAGLAPMHISALVGPFTVLLAFAQTASLIVELNTGVGSSFGGIERWPSLLQTTLTGLSDLPSSFGVDSWLLPGVAESCASQLSTAETFTLALFAPILAVLSLLLGTLVFTIFTAYWLPPKEELPRIGRHAVAVCLACWTMLAIPWLRSFSSPLNCRQAADPTGSVVMVMASDTAVRCDATDPAYSAATAAMSDSLVKAAALFVIATAVFALLPSRLLGIVSNKYRAPLNPTVERIAARFGGWELLVQLRKLLLVFGVYGRAGWSASGSTVAIAVATLVHVLALSLQITVQPFDVRGAPHWNGPRFACADRPGRWTCRQEKWVNAAEGWCLAVLLLLLIASPVAPALDESSLVAPALAAAVGLAVLLVVIAQIFVALSTTKLKAGYKEETVAARIRQTTDLQTQLQTQLGAVQTARRDALAAVGKDGEVQTAANPAEAYQPPVTNHEGDGGAYMGDGLKETF